jgi:ribosomal-protein-alanine N-acetyltransferase
MQITLTSERLSLSLLQPADAEFIYELVNTPDWVKFIGDRKVTSKAKAEGFVQSIMDNTDVNYWVVRLKDGNVPTGIVSLVKRDYLDSHDVGFAFLPEYTKKGLAYEAARVLLHHLAEENLFPKILATTIKGNSSSIALLEKLGFRFDRQIENSGEELFVYEAPLSDFR